MDTVVAVEQYLVSMLKLIVNNPDRVETFCDVGKDERGELHTIHVKVHNDDIGLCIGEGGSTAEALRRVIGLIATRQLKQRVFIKIDTPRIPRNHFNFNE